MENQTFMNNSRLPPSLYTVHVHVGAVKGCWLSHIFKRKLYVIVNFFFLILFWFRGIPSVYKEAVAGICEEVCEEGQVYWG